MRRLITRLREERGASVVLVGILLVPLLGAAAISVDVGAMYAERAQLQNGADAGALAAAQYCGKHGNCTTSTQKDGARTAALAVVGGNLLDGSAGVDPLVFGADTVRVTAKTIAMEHPLAAALGIAESDIAAAGTAKWEAGTNASVVPFAVGECSVPSGTGTIDVIPIDNVPCPGGVPGGFGWLDDGTTSCIKDVALGEFTTITTGNTGKCDLTNVELAAAAAQLGCSLSSVPKSYKRNTEKLFYCFVGRTILVPVYTLASNCTGSPGGKAYCIEKFAAFEIYGMHIKVNGSDKVEECKSGYKCDLDKSWGHLEFEGRFIAYVTADDSWMLGPPTPSVRLIG